MNRAAAFNTAICTVAIGAISAAASTFIAATAGGPLDAVRVLGALGALGVGSWLIYVGHCRNLMPKGG